ncbi:MAG: FtsX-like permease family protein [Flavobacteriales bacterium]|nr:FtsX-like permease family protein [Flavobacteriales bacterium]
MNTEFHIAKGIIKGKLTQNSSSKPIISASITTISVGIIVLIIAIATGKGFKEKIEEKMSFFTADIRVSFNNNSDIHHYKPLEKDDEQTQKFSQIEGVSSIYKASYKVGVLKNGKEVHQVFFKGVDSEFPWKRFEKFIVSGSVPKTGTKEVLVSQKVIDLLGYKLGNDLIITFFDDDKQRIKSRKLKIVGIYKSGFSEFDKQYILGDLAMIQKLNRWKKGEFSFWEIYIKDKSRLEEMREIVNAQSQFYHKISTYREIYPNIFHWTDSFDYNIYILIIIIGAVTSINMVSTVLIILLERSQMIGVLKTLGMENGKIRKLFSYYLLYLVGKGIFWGNLIAISFCLIQSYFKIIPLPSEGYHIDHVPIQLNFSDIISVNILVLSIVFIVMFLPLLYIRRLQPSRILRFK